MSNSTSDEFINHLAEVIYGDEFTKHDKQNIKKKYLPIFDMKSNLIIRDPQQSHDFLVSYYEMFRELNTQFDRISIYKKKVMDNDSLKENYGQLRMTYYNLKEEYDKLKNDKNEDVKKNPCYIELVKERDYWKLQANNFESQYQAEKEYLENRRKEYDSYLEHKSEIEDKLDEEFEKKKASFIRKAKQENKDEESVKMKALKDEVASLKKKISKYDKKVKTQKKEIKALQLKVVDLSDSGSDIDSDSD